MVSDSVRAFVDAIARHQLLDADRLRELTRILQGRFPDPRALGKELISRGWLTPFQVNQLALGKAGRLVLGQYLLLERLGEGGMGQVFKGRHQRLDRVVALKIIRQDHLDNRNAIGRFHREAQAAAKLDHVNIVRVYDFSEELGTHYLVMEYVDGKDLKQVLKESGSLAIPLGCDYIRQAALGLEHAHERGLVHRDIKPANLFLAQPVPTSPGVVKILDMGLARVRPMHHHEKLASSMTREGSVVGTLDYMAPEQAKSSRDVDGRADLYSLGCTLFHLLTGKPPFVGGAGVEKLMRHQLDPPPPLRSLRPDAPEALAEVLARMLAKRPEDRYATATDVVCALEPFCGRNPPSANVTTTPRPAAVPQQAAPSSDSWSKAIPTLSRVPDRPRQPRRNLWLVLALATLPLLILVTVAVALFAVSGSPSSTTPTPTPTPPATSPKPPAENPPPTYHRYVTDETVLVTTVDMKQLLHSPLGQKYVLPGFRQGVARQPMFQQALDVLGLDAARDIDRVTALSPAGVPDRPLVVFQGRFKDAKFPKESSPFIKIRTPTKGALAGTRMFQVVGDAKAQTVTIVIVGTDTIVATTEEPVLFEALVNREPRGPVKDLLKELTGKEMIGIVGVGRALGRINILEKIDQDNLLAEQTTIRGHVLMEPNAISAEVVFDGRKEGTAQKLKEILDMGVRHALLAGLPIATERKDMQALTLLIRTGNFTAEGNKVVFGGRVTEEMLNK